MKFIGNIDAIRFAIESSRKDAYIEWNSNKSKVIGYVYIGRTIAKHMFVYIIEFEKKYNLIEFKIKKE